MLNAFYPKFLVNRFEIMQFSLLGYKRCGLRFSDDRTFFLRFFEDMCIISVSPSVRICANRTFFSAFAQIILGHARALRIKIHFRANCSGPCAKKKKKNNETTRIFV